VPPETVTFVRWIPAGTPVRPTHRLRTFRRRGHRPKHWPSRRPARPRRLLHRPLPHQPPLAVGPLSEGNGALPDGQSPHRRALPAAPTARTATGFLPAPGQV